MSATTSPRSPEEALGRAPGDAAQHPGGVAAARPPRTIRLHAVSAEDVLVPAAAAVAALALVWYPYENVLPFSGVLGFWLCWFVAFLLLYGGVAGLRLGRPATVGPRVAAGTAPAGIFARA